jgi:hypothetical protein
MFDSQPAFTYELAAGESFTITPEMGFEAFAFLPIGDVATVLGTGKAAGIDSKAFTLPDGTGTTYSRSNNGNINGLTVTAGAGGTVAIMAG